MAYRRGQSGSLRRVARNHGEGGEGEEESSPASSLAAKAIRASSSSAATRDSSLSSAYAHHSFPKPEPPADVSLPSSPSSPSFSRKDKVSYQYTSMDTLSEPKHGFWSTLARKAKSIIEDDPVDHTQESHRRTDKLRPEVTFGSQQYYKSSESSESHRRTDSVMLQKGLGAISSSLNFIGGTIGNAFEEGLAKVENGTADIIHETRKLQSKKKGSNRELHKQIVNDGDVNQDLMHTQTHAQTQRQTSWDIQLKASRDVAMAMAAKTKLLLRELKTVKADLAFAKERCAQLEDENKILRESMGKGDNPEDDDLVRLQLETLLAEKARLAHENSIYARENRFLREIVEYHQLTMQDVVYIDEKREEVSEVYPKLSSGTDLPTVASMLPTSPSASETSRT